MIALVSLIVVDRMVNRGAFLMGYSAPACLVVPAGYVPIAASAQSLTLFDCHDAIQGARRQIIRGGRYDLHDTYFSRYRLLPSKHHKRKQAGAEYPTRKAHSMIALVSLIVVDRMVNRGAFLMGYSAPACLVVPAGYVPIAASAQSLTFQIVTMQFRAHADK